MLLKVLDFGLLEIRSRSAHQGATDIWIISDALHHVPGLLAQVAAGKYSAEEALEILKTSHHPRRQELWLSGILNSISEPASSPEEDDQHD